MLFHCSTEDYTINRTAPEQLGSPITAASWFYEQLQPHEQYEGLKIRAIWRDKEGVQQEQLYEVTSRGTLVAS